MQRGCYWKWGIIALVVAVLVFPGWSGVALGADGASGKAVYETNACSACHGPNGDGGLGPSLKGPEFSKKYANPDKLVEVIHAGSGTMPGYPPERIDREQMDSLVSFIVSLAKSDGETDDEGSTKGEVVDVYFGSLHFEQLYGLAVMVLGLLLLAFFGLMLNGPFKVRKQEYFRRR